MAPGEVSVVLRQNVEETTMMEFSERRFQTSVRIICASLSFVCGTVVSADGGSIVAWGHSGYGQCNVPNPNLDFVSAAGGFCHSLGLKTDGSIVAWGENYLGQCNVPNPNSDFVAVAAGGGYYPGGHSLGLKSNGLIRAWGENYCGQCNVPSPNENFTAIAAGMDHSLGLKTDGSIVAWGDNYSGQCNVPDPNTDFVAVAGGGIHSLGLKANGSIVVWGAIGNVPDPNTDFVAVAGGGTHSLGLKANGSIVAWGGNQYGQCNVPEPNADFIAIAGGWGHSLGVKSDGSIVAWGRNSDGQCNVPDPNTDFTAIAGGFHHTLGLTDVSYGACCLVGEPCLFTTQQDCDFVLGGIYMGDGVTCDPNPCPGACCLNGIECVDTVTQSDCETIYRGIWQGTDTLCASINCPVVYKLLADDGVDGDYFGGSVSISGDYMVVGAPGAINRGRAYGSAYVYQKIDTHWEQVATLIPSYGSPEGSFGVSVSISEDTIVVGAPDTSWVYPDPGTAYVFDMPAGGWSGTLNEDALLLASDGEGGDRFGYSIGVSDEWVVVGMKDYGIFGTAYVFRKPAGGWSGTLNEWCELRPSDAEDDSTFGYSVSISGDTIVVGAPNGGDFDGGEELRVYPVYVYEELWMYGQGTHYEDAKLLPSYHTPQDYFGRSLSFSDDIVVVGTPAGDPQTQRPGSAYVFKEPIGGWEGVGIINESAKLLPSDGTMFDSIGVSVSISGDTVVVGAPGRYWDSLRGSAYIFQKPVNGWSGELSEETKLLAFDGNAGDAFGRSTFISGETIVIGAPQCDDMCPGDPDCNSGSAYVFEMGSAPCPADLTGDDQVNIDDVFAVLGLWGDCDDPCPPYCDGDLTEDCIVNIDDIFAILGEWGPCP